MMLQILAGVSGKSAAPAPTGPYKLMTFGDSTMAGYINNTPFEDVWFTPEEESEGYQIQNKAISGQSIEQQHAIWTALSDSDKKWPDVIYVQVGLNNLINGATYSGVFAALQSFATDIASGKRTNAKVVFGSMTPNYKRIDDLHTDPTKSTLKAIWLSVYNNIQTLTGITTYAKEHSVAMAEAGQNGYLATILDSGDGIHPTADGVVLNVQKVRLTIDPLFA